MATPTSDDPLSEFTLSELTFLGLTKRIWRAGIGPAVIVMHEMPGISPQLLRFTRWVRDAGFSVWLPSLFGTGGAIGTAEEGAAVYRRACVSAEFRALGAGASSPVSVWLIGGVSRMRTRLWLTRLPLNLPCLRPRDSPTQPGQLSVSSYTPDG